MKKIVILITLVLLIVGVSLYFGSRHLNTSKHSAPSSNRQTVSIDHIAVIVMENKRYDAIVGSSAAPYINALLQEYALAKNYYAITNPSLPNYLALVGGSTFGVTSNCINCFIAATNLVDQLEVHNKTWKGYMESMPENCYIGYHDPYAQKHNPFVYFDDIRNNPQRCNNDVPLDQLYKDLQSEKTTPNFMFITPNLCNDMHDCSIQQGDTWLSHIIPTLLQSPAFQKQRSFIVLTWDEAEAGSSNQIPIIFIGNTVKKKFSSELKYNHYSLLHTIEAVWGIPPITDEVKNAPVMTEFLQLH